MPVNSFVLKTEMNLRVNTVRKLVKLGEGGLTLSYRRYLNKNLFHYKLTYICLYIFSV